MNKMPEIRFWEKVSIDDGENTCWLWGGATDRRYGLFYCDGKQVKAHRFAYETHAGPIPQGLQLDHLCRVHICVRPSHLEPVTHAENMRRGIGGWHQRVKASCKMGHPYSGDNLFTRKNGMRECRTCMRASVRRNRVKAFVK